MVFCFVHLHFSFEKFRCTQLAKAIIRTVIGSLLTNHGFYFWRDAANTLLCLSSSSLWAQVTGASFSVPFFRLNVGTGDRRKLLCALLLPQCGHRSQEQASLCPSSAAAWAQMTGASFSVPFFRRSVGTGDRRKLLCALLTPQRGHR